MTDLICPACGLQQCRCDMCGLVFHPARSEEEGLAEAQENFPGLAAEDRAVVCERCFWQIMGYSGTEGEEKA